MSYAPLGDDADFPADPDGVRGYGDSVSATGALILEQVALLESLARGDCWVADTADAFREQAQELADRIEKSAGRYTRVGKALTTLADDLEDYERWAGQRAEEARALQWTVVANPPATPEVPPEGGLPVLTPAGEAQNARRRRAEERIEVLQGEFDGYVRRAREAASDAASTIKGAIDDDVKDNWWERNAGWLSTAKDWLGLAAAAVGIVLAVVAAIATAPVWLTVLAVGLAAAVLAISLGLALGADGSWTDVAFDAVGLATLGTGAVFSRLAARGFPAVRSAVAGIRASRASQAVRTLNSPAALRELRRIASVAVDPSGANLVARGLLAEVTRNSRAAAAAVRSATLSPFPVTLTQRVVDGGLDSSRIARQSREMLLDLRTMPGAPVDPAVLADATRLVRVSTAGIVATNTGAASQVVDLLRDPESSLRDGGPLQIVTDLVSRLQ